MSSGWALLLLLVTAVLMIWFMVRTVRHNPEAFSKANVGKSFYTVGILTLLIIGVIAVCVMLLRS